MLFFFEMFLFVLVMLTLALGEFVSRWLALVLWLVVTVFTLIGYLLARQSLRGIIAGGDAPLPASGVLPSSPTPAMLPAEPASLAEAPPVTDAPRPDRQPAALPLDEGAEERAEDGAEARGAPEGMTAAPREVTPLDAKWARTILYNWRRTNALLLLGVVVVGGWYWLGG